MSAIIFLPSIRGARYYVRRVRKEHCPEELHLVHDREEATVFDEDEARALAKALHAEVRPPHWAEDDTKVCSVCRQAKTLEHFYSAANARYPLLRRSLCKPCDNARRNEFKR